MKIVSRALAASVVCAFAFLLMACPVSTSYPLGEKNSEKIDKALLGTWKNDSVNAEAQQVTLTQADDYTYSLKVEKKGSMYMAETDDFQAWLTSIDNHRFLVLQEVGEGVAKETYYVYHIEFEGKKLRTNDITLKVNGTDAITSIPAYREEVKASMSKEGFLAGPIVWRK